MELSDNKSSPLQLPTHPPSPVYGEIQVDLIHFIKNPLILLAKPDPFAIERGFHIDTFRSIARYPSPQIPYLQALELFVLFF